VSAIDEFAVRLVDPTVGHRAALSAPRRLRFDLVLSSDGAGVEVVLMFDTSGHRTFGLVSPEDHVVVAPWTEFDSSATPLKSPTPTPLVLDQPLPPSFRE
jgi:hypothetical protein